MPHPESQPRPTAGQALRQELGTMIRETSQEYGGKPLFSTFIYPTLPHPLDR